MPRLEGSSGTSAGGAGRVLPAEEGQEADMNPIRIPGSVEPVLPAA